MKERFERFVVYLVSSSFTVVCILIVLLVAGDSCAERGGQFQDLSCQLPAPTPTPQPTLTPILGGTR